MVQTKLYQFSALLSIMVHSSSVAIIGVPQDLGASRRGVDMGPSAIRVAGLRQALMKLGHKVVDFGI